MDTFGHPNTHRHRDPNRYSDMDGDRYVHTDRNANPN